LIVSRGSQPSWIACRVIEKAPVMIDWLGDDGGDRRQHDQRQQQHVRAEP